MLRKSRRRRFNNMFSRSGSKMMKKSGFRWNETAESFLSWYTTPVVQDRTPTKSLSVWTCWDNIKNLIAKQIGELEQMRSELEIRLEKTKDKATPFLVRNKTMISIHPSDNSHQPKLERKHIKDSLIQISRSIWSCGPNDQMVDSGAKRSRSILSSTFSEILTESDARYKRRVESWNWLRIGVFRDDFGSAIVVDVLWVLPPMTGTKRQTQSCRIQNAPIRNEHSILRTNYSPTEFVTTWHSPLHWENNRSRDVPRSLGARPLHRVSIRSYSPSKKNTTGIWFPFHCIAPYLQQGKRISPWNRLWTLRFLANFSSRLSVYTSHRFPSESLKMWRRVCSWIFWLQNRAFDHLGQTIKWICWSVWGTL